VTSGSSNRRPTPLQTLLCASLVMALALGVRQSLSLFLVPMTTDGVIGREGFSFGLGVQNLVWGLSGPLAGWYADRHGTRIVVFACSVAFTLGICAMALAGSVFGVVFGAGLLAGVGLTGTTFTVLFGAIAHAYPAERRARALAIGAAVGSVGQVVLVPIAQHVVNAFGWHTGLWALVGISALAIPVAMGFAGQPTQTAPSEARPRGADLGAAIKDRKYQLVALGFFSCGLQLVFVGTHLAAYLVGCGLSASDGVLALSLIGLFNVAGTFALGKLAGKYEPSHVLAAVYAARTLFMVAFLLLPLSRLSTMVFASAMGLLWLGVGPVMTQLLALRFGVRHVAALFGGMYLIHQVGSFLGAWMGGRIFAETGSYSEAWIMCIVAGAVAVGVTVASGTGPWKPKPARSLSPAS
jgi:predicted MFS family arabinose efflux permease